MFDPTVIQMGPLFLPTVLVVAAVLLFASVWLAERLSPRKKHVERKVSEWLPTALLIVLLVYKFGPALLDLKQVLQQPLMLLYVSGNGTSMVAAVLLSGGWLAWKIVKHAHSWALTDIVAVAGALAIFGYNVVFKDLGAAISEYYHPLNGYRVLLILLLLVWVFRKWPHLDSGTIFSRTALWIGFIYTLTSFADYQAGRLLIGLSPTQLVGVLLTVGGFALMVIQDWGKTYFSR